MSQSSHLSTKFLQRTSTAPPQNGLAFTPRPFAQPSLGLNPMPLVAKPAPLTNSSGHSFGAVNIHHSSPPPQKNRTGLPDKLKAGIESLSGLAMDDIKVHYNSVKPAQIQALAYTQGTNIHVGPRQEKHPPHEAWHVVQQKQGRVQPTIQAKGVAINDDQGLEREANVMGARASQVGSRSWQRTEASDNSVIRDLSGQFISSRNPATFVQRARRTPELLALDDIRRFQGTVANQFVGLHLPGMPQHQPHVIQRVQWNEDNIMEYKRLLGIKETTPVKIVTVPDNEAAKVTTPFSADVYNPHRYELETEDLNKSLFLVNKLEESKRAEMDQKKAFDYMRDSVGGAGYIAGSWMIIMNDTASQRDLLHEMGHLKQHQEGFHGDKDDKEGYVEPKILEYHNILKHENLYDEKLRIHYSQARFESIEQTKRISDNVVKGMPKNWEKLKGQLRDQKQDKSVEMLEQIEDILSSDPKYRELEVAIKLNLINEIQRG